MLLGGLCRSATQHMCPPHVLQPINRWDLLVSVGHPSKFQRFRVLPSLMQRRRSPEANQLARCLAISWAATLYIFGGSCPLTEFTGFCPVQNSLYVQVLRSPILGALLHGTPAAAVSQILRRGTRSGITELSHRAPPIFGRAAITFGIGPHSSSLRYDTTVN